MTELFSSRAEREAFARTREHAEIMTLLEQFQTRDEEDLEPPDAKGRFVLRLQRSLHVALTAEARSEGVSLNQLCVAKLATRLARTVTIR
jgi:predicted HicB family RNase H-like nuclease